MRRAWYSFPRSSWNLVCTSGPDNLLLDKGIDVVVHMEPQRSMIKILEIRSITGDCDVFSAMRRRVRHGPSEPFSRWAVDDSRNAALTAIKREDGAPGRSVAKDYHMHLRVVQSIERRQIRTPLAVPRCDKLIEPTDEWWYTQLQQFPPSYTACKALISERIPKVPKTISDKIVDLFCDGNASLASFVKSNEDDDSCLIRPYLGRRRRHRQGGTSNSRFQRFSLRNVPLHVDQMEALHLDTHSYAKTMADALALMHWDARIDANDVEYVLAPPRESEVHSPSTLHCEYLGLHSMWILDFDCCQPLSMDETGVEQACAAFFKNDPFYPRPGGDEAADTELWAVFKSRFLSTSRRILEEKVVLADKLIQRIEEEGVSRNRARKQAA